MIGECDFGLNVRHFNDSNLSLERQMISQKLIARHKKQNRKHFWYLKEQQRANSPFHSLYLQGYQWRNLVKSNELNDEPICHIGFTQEFHADKSSPQINISHIAIATQQATVIIGRMNLFVWMLFALSFIFQSTLSLKYRYQKYLSWGTTFELYVICSWSSEWPS